MKTFAPFIFELNSIGGENNVLIEVNNQAEVSLGAIFLAKIKKMWWHSGKRVFLKLRRCGFESCNETTELNAASSLEFANSVVRTAVIRWDIIPIV